METSHSSALVSGLIRLSGYPGPFIVETEGQQWHKKEPYGMGLLVMASQKEEGTLGYKSPVGRVLTGMGRNGEGAGVGQPC